MNSRDIKSVKVHTIPVPTPFPVGPVNVHLVAADPVTLIDTGPHTEDAWEALRHGLKRAGLSIFDVERVLLTHGRPTARLLDRLARGGFGYLERLAVMVAVSAVDHFAEPLRAWRELSGGEELPGDGYSIAVQSTPGHTPGSLTFAIPQTGLLFTGDTVLRDITPNAIVDEDPESPGETFRSLSRYFESLDDISASHSGARLLTGHGRSIPDFDSHHGDVVLRYQARLQKLNEALASGPKTVRELVTILFPRVQTLNIYLAYSEVLGFLMYLEDQGRVEKLQGRNLDRYVLNPN
ncbi:MAG: MBL fold metallo-hydrolase [Thermoanaerobaculia bacterium]|nr:MBL fold metallo-hydrolase [Thermoanaerobaculia bacterium]